jgi:hypothetical protein
MDMRNPQAVAGRFNSILKVTAFLPMVSFRKKRSPELSLAGKIFVNRVAATPKNRE